MKNSKPIIEANRIEVYYDSTYFSSARAIELSNILFCSANQIFTESITSTLGANLTTVYPFHLLCIVSGSQNVFIFNGHIPKPLTNKNIKDIFVNLLTSYLKYSSLIRQFLQFIISSRKWFFIVMVTQYFLYSRNRSRLTRFPYILVYSQNLELKFYFIAYSNVYSNSISIFPDRYLSILDGFPEIGISNIFNFCWQCNNTFQKINKN